MATRLPVAVALATLLLGGWFLLDRADAQARDTIRKHHLEDIEQALYFTRGLNGTYPPYNQPSWCGQLNASGNESVREPIEAALRAQNDKYANSQKPFPRDPLVDRAPPIASADSGATGGRSFSYFYWKRSPAIFELYATLEVDQNAERSTINCANAPALAYDYGLTSVWRENR